MIRPTPEGVLVLPASAPRADWLAERRTGITATDVVKIVGLSPYGNALDVYLDKRVPEDDYSPGEAARWGQMLEEPVAREWAKREGARVRRVGLLRNITHRWSLASCDRLVIGRHAPLEVKTKSAFQSDAWVDGVPDHVAAQVQWQLMVTGFARCFIAALVGGQKLESFEVRRDEDVIAYLMGEGQRVWDAVLAGEPPEVDPRQLTAESLNRLHPDRGGSVILPTAAADLLQEYAEAGSAERAAKDAKEAAKLELIRLLGDAEEGLLGDRTAFTYRQGKPRRSLQAAELARLEATHPEIRGYITETPASRTFRITKGKS